MDRLRPFAPTVIRLTLGMIAIVHALRSFGAFGGNINTLARILAEHTPLQSRPFAYLLAGLLLVGGILVLLGCFIKLASALVFLVTLGWVMIDRLYSSFFIDRGGVAAHLAVLAMALSLFLSGPGDWAIELKKKQQHR